MGFTPGPWSSEDGKMATSNCFFIKSIIPNSYIALVYDCEDVHANATLLALAPELLKALETCVEIIKNEYPEEQWNDYKVDEFEALISKAKGE